MNGYIYINSMGEGSYGTFLLTIIVDKHSGQHIWEYDEDDYWHVAVDSGGMYCGGKYFVKKGATKSKEKVLERIEGEIRSLERQIERKKADYQRVQNNEVNINWI